MSEFPKIGAFVLETLTTGMYTNPLDTIREFIQNATDSILRASGTFVQNYAGRIEIQIEPASRRLVIRDNGIGIPNTDVYSRLINIGMSDKNLATSAGFRGIGRLSGIAYCQRLYFRTSAIGEKIISTIEINCVDLRKAILPGMRQVEVLADVMEKNCKRLPNEECTINDHFFEVVMEGISDAADDFLDWKILESYLSQVAPVEFDAQKFIYAPKILEWINKNNILIPTVTLVIKGPGVEREIFKSYKNNYKTQKTKNETFNLPVNDVCFYPAKITQDSPFWIWYSKTDLLGIINCDKSAGFRLRSKNISIGMANRVDELFSEIAKTNNRFNAYYIGEIHILSSKVIPNARRDGFENVEDWPEIKASLKFFIKDRVEEIRKCSQNRNRPTQKIIRAVDKVIQEANGFMQTGFVSKQQRSDFIEHLTREKTRTEEAFASRQESEDAEKLKVLSRKLETTLHSVEKKSSYVGEKLRPDLDRKQRKIITEILQILHQTLDGENFKAAESAILAQFQVKPSEIKK